VSALPESDWRAHSGLQRIIRTLSDGEVKPLAVGGAVRDSLLGLPVSDVDLATALRPDEVIRRLETAGIKAIPTGIAHGTITAVADGRSFEITTLRRDVATDGRRATVAFSHDWREDAERRDFTMNALYADIQSGEIFDSVGGLADLDARHVRFIGDAAQRIAEDYLRILRYYRFLARFGEDPADTEALAACRDAAPSLKSLSRERIADELMKLLATDDPRAAIGHMLSADIFAHIVSEIDGDAAGMLDRVVTREQAHGIAPCAMRRLTAMLPKSPELSGKIASKLRLSKKMQAGLVSRMDFASAPVDAGAIPAIAYHTSEEAARDIALLFAPDSEVAACLTALGNWERPDFPLKGSDLIAMGLTPGPAVSHTLEAIRTAWIAEGFPDTSRVRALAHEVIG